MTDKYGSTLQIGAEVIFVTNANTAPYIEVGRVTKIYGDACTIKSNGKSHSHIYSHRIVCRDQIEKAFQGL